MRTTVFAALLVASLIPVSNQSVCRRPRKRSPRAQAGQLSLDAGPKHECALTKNPNVMPLRLYQNL